LSWIFEDRRSVIQLVVSDSSRLIDLRKGGLLSTTLLLPFRFVVALPLVASELLEFTKTDWKDLETRGLGIVDLNPDQVRRAFELKSAHAALSPYDCFSLAIAEASTGAILLTGDRQLRQRATSLGVEVHGILWVADQIERLGKMPLSDLVDELERWATDPLVFLPRKELTAMIERMRDVLSGRRIQG
jgi:predicted nucleic acid-binding protein